MREHKLSCTAEMLQQTYMKHNNTFIEMLSFSYWTVWACDSRNKVNCSCNLLTAMLQFQHL